MSNFNGEFRPWRSRQDLAGCAKSGIWVWWDAATVPRSIGVLRMSCSHLFAPVLAVALAIPLPIIAQTRDGEPPHPLATPGPIDITFSNGVTWRVVDGDSIVAPGPVAPSPSPAKPDPVEWRLTGFDTAELDAKCEAERRLAIMAQRRLADLLRTAKAVDLVDSGERDRYRRPLGRLMIDGRDAGAIMIAELLARPYRGGPRKGWCSRDSRDDLVVAPPSPTRETGRKP